MQLDTEWTQSNLISLCGPLNKREPVPQRDAVICQASPRESKANMGFEPKSGRQRQPLTSCGLGCMSFSSCFLLLIGLCHHSGKAGRWGKGQHKEVQRLRGDSSPAESRQGSGEQLQYYPQACGSARELHAS